MASMQSMPHRASPASSLHSQHAAMLSSLHLHDLHASDEANDDDAEADSVHERAHQFDDAFIIAVRMFDLAHMHGACYAGPAPAQHVGSAENAGILLEEEYYEIMQAALDEEEEERRRERVRLHQARGGGRA